MISRIEIKKLWKYFLLIFFILFVLFNWSDIFWVFNYQAVFGVLSEFVKTSEPEKQEFSPQVVSGEEPEEKQEIKYFEKNNTIEIPKIGITAPVIFIDQTASLPIDKALDTGTVHFPSSVLPGEAGQTVILGHSAPDGWPKIRYDGVFSELNELVQGDEIYLYFDNNKLSYSVTGKYFLERGEELPQSLTNSENVLVLISCWPPGKDYRRIAVVAQREH